MATYLERRPVKRRALIVGVGGTLLGIAVSKNASSNQSQYDPVTSGDCRPEPGVELLAEWNLGMSQLDPISLLPPLTWVRFIHPTIPVTFLFPPDWTAVPLCADGISPTGMPNWTYEPIALPLLTVERIISPDGYAAFEFVSGTVAGVALTPADAARVAEQGILGEGAQLTSLCTFEQSNPLVSSWFHAGYAGSSVLVTEGWPLGQSGLFGPSTILNSYSMFGPQDQFELLMRTVFIPILAQLSGGPGHETPTPEPW